LGIGGREKCAKKEVMILFPFRPGMLAIGTISTPAGKKTAAVMIGRTTGCARSRQSGAQATFSAAVTPSAKEHIIPNQIFQADE
jgi:hypothetical protein